MNWNMQFKDKSILYRRATSCPPLTLNMIFRMDGLIKLNVLKTQDPSLHAPKQPNNQPSRINPEQVSGLSIRSISKH